MSISEMADVTKGKLPKTLLSNPTERSVPYLLIDGLNNGASLHTEDTDLPMITPEDTVVVADGSRSGLPIRGISGALGSTLLRYRAKEGFDGDFLYYLLESLYPFTNTATIGGAVPHLDKRLLSQLVLKIPRQPERKMLGKIFRAVDEVVSATNAELLAAQRLKTALMQQLFTKGIPGRHKEFKETIVGRIPKDWDVVQLKDLIRSSQYGLSESFSQRGQYQILRMTNIEDGFVHTRDPVYIDLDNATYQTYRLEVGDILFNRTNSLELVGRVGIVKDQIDAVFASYLVRLRADTEKVDAFFLNYCLNSYRVKCRYRRFATPAVGQANINPRNLMRTLIALPKKKSGEQMDIVQIISECDQAIECIRKKQDALVFLKKSLLQNLLTGKVRVNTEAQA
jgi:type I restriction enzyme S subunit